MVRGSIPREFIEKQHLTLQCLLVAFKVLVFVVLGISDRHLVSGIREYRAGMWYKKGKSSLHIWNNASNVSNFVVSGNYELKPFTGPSPSALRFW